MKPSAPISGNLLKIKQRIEKIAKEYGLDFFDTIFEECDYDTINVLAAQGGFPSRYPHWQFGMQYDQLSKGYAYGIQKIYEMVVNTDPCYAYLLKGNNLLDQKLVMSHVYGHNDFFKNNAWFSQTNRKMIDVLANNGTKIRRYMSKYGANKVESFIDQVLSLENLLDPSELFEKNKRSPEVQVEKDDSEGLSDSLASFMRSKNKREKKEEELKESPIQMEAFPKEPVKDVLKFLIDHAPLENWQADILGILREEAYYFLPQRMTKIMNEGWASFWHSKMMTEKVMDSSEFIDFADRHASVMVMNRQQMNPYKIGIEMFRDILFRWDTGRFGADYNNCTKMEVKENWNEKTLKGMEKIFMVRKSHNDLTFIDEFLTPEFCNRQKIFTYKFNQKSKRYEIDSRDFEAIKQKLLMNLTNFGQPFIKIENANYRNRGELLLVHDHHGVDLDGQFTHATLKNLYAIWKRPVALKTFYEEKEAEVYFDGEKFETLS